MHEYSIVQALLSEAEAHARAHSAQSVTRLELRLGELAGVDRELLATAYDTFRAHTLCESAKLDIRWQPAIWACPLCREELPPGGVLRCADCEAPARLVEGEDIFLDRIEMEIGDV